MYYRDRGACFEVGGGRISRELFHAGRLDYYPLKKWGGHGPASPCSAVPVFLHAQERIRNSELIASVHKIN